MERDLPVGTTGIGLQSLRRACSSVRLSARPRISETTRQNFTKFSMHVTVAGSILFWWRCDMVCTSGFVDGVIFA